MTTLAVTFVRVAREPEVVGSERDHLEFGAMQQQVEFPHTVGGPFVTTRRPRFPVR